MQWASEFDFRSPPHIVFGPNTVARLGEIASGLGSKAPLLMADPVVHRLGFAEGAEQSLRDAGLSVRVYSDIATEPTLASVEDAVRAFRDGGCDLIVAMGGGSTIDSSKSVSLLLGNEGKLSEYQQLRIGSDWIPKRRVQRRGAHIIAIPTTAGTGSEVTAGSGVFDPESGIKGWAGDPVLRASAVICDPTLHVSMPPHVTADTGTDALSQAVECYLNTGFKPTCDALALKSIETIGRYLPLAYANGEDLEARSAMLWAANTVGLAFGNGGLIHNHTFAEVLGDLTHLPHGRLLGMTLPYILDFNLEGCEEKLADIGRALGADLSGESARDDAEASVSAVRKLLADVHNDDPLSKYEVTEEQLNVAADRVYAQHEARSASSPKGFETREDVMWVLESAY